MFVFFVIIISNLCHEMSFWLIFAFISFAIHPSKTGHSKITKYLIN